MPGEAGGWHGGCTTTLAMNSLLRTLTILAFAATPYLATAQPAPASAAAPAQVEAVKAAPAAPALDQRVADLEAYVNNLGPKAGDDKVAAGPIAASAGPGHNAFMMICAALVLFMTLPGLFLFYGGLVRAKNVLSLAAQCFGLAGMVAILWWAVGYSLVFGKNFDG